MSLFHNEPDPRADYRALLPEPGPRPPREPAPISPERWWAFGLAVAGACGFFWSLWSNWPEFAAPVLIVVPPVALGLAARWPRRVTLAHSEKWDRRAPLSHAVYFAMSGLAIGAWRCFPTFEFDTAALWASGAAVAIGAVFAALAARLDRERMSEPLMRVTIGVGGAVWAAGLLLQVNGAVDVRIASRTPVEVLDKQVWQRRHGDTYRLRVVSAAAGVDDYVDVDPGLYARTPVGAPVCRVTWRGALRLHWRTTERCGL